ncbi:hypothetical protein [Mesorhizobium sp. M0898]|uniref:hypothetical protein n=1 Tax=Mesorhizobium sp. M0898 TaxID=2957020 RepID=UPI003339C32B
MSNSCTGLRLVMAFALLTSPAYGQQTAGAASPAHIADFEFTSFLRDRPLDLDQLLGRHFSEVVPGATWEGLPTPEEYKNPSIRYGVFARPGPFMNNWHFMKEPYCVSHYSMFILFFNHGFVFKVELRFVSDSFAGQIDSHNASFCGNEIPIFDNIAKELGDSVIKENGSREIKRYTDNYVMTLSADDNGADLSWDLRGGPSLPNF